MNSKLWGGINVMNLCSQLQATEYYTPQLRPFLTVNLFLWPSVISWSQNECSLDNSNQPELNYSEL